MSLVSAIQSSIAQSNSGHGPILPKGVVRVIATYHLDSQVLDRWLTKRTLLGQGKKMDFDRIGLSLFTATLKDIEIIRRASPLADSLKNIIDTESADFYDTDSMQKSAHVSNKVVDEEIAPRLSKIGKEQGLCLSDFAPVVDGLVNGAIKKSIQRDNVKNHDMAVSLARQVIQVQLGVTEEEEPEVRQAEIVE